MPNPKKKASDKVIRNRFYRNIAQMVTRQAISEWTQVGNTGVHSDLLALFDACASVTAYQSNADKASVHGKNYFTTVNLKSMELEGENGFSGWVEENKRKLDARREMQQKRKAAEEAKREAREANPNHNETHKERRERLRREVKEREAEDEVALQQEDDALVPTPSKAKKEMKSKKARAAPPIDDIKVEIIHPANTIDAHPLHSQDLIVPPSFAIPPVASVNRPHASGHSIHRTDDTVPGSAGQAIADVMVKQEKSEIRVKREREEEDGGEGKRKRVRVKKEMSVKLEVEDVDRLV